MDDLLGYHFPRQWPQGALNTEIDRFAELLFKIAPDTKEIPQGLPFGLDLYGNVDIGIFTGLSPGITAEEPDAHHAETLRHQMNLPLAPHRLGILLQGGNAGQAPHKTWRNRADS